MTVALISKDNILRNLGRFIKSAKDLKANYCSILVIDDIYNEAVDILMKHSMVDRVVSNGSTIFMVGETRVTLHKLDYYV